MTRRLASLPNGKPSPWRKVTAGARLYVRENFARVPSSAYRMSDGVQQTVDPGDRDFAVIYAAGWERSAPKWKPCIHMPRWASRLTLVVTATKIERLQEISHEDAVAEGCYRIEPCAEYPNGNAWGRAGFAALWESLHGAGSWEKNPELIALTFTVHKVNIDQMAKAA